MTNDSRALLEQLLDGKHLSEAQAGDTMRILATGELEPARAGALLAALRANGETADEIRGFANAMRELARPFPGRTGDDAADSVGTGGDASGSLNISTGTALLAAACGIPMIKHGNRSVSSKSGSADVLEALGITLPGDPQIAADCLTHTNFTFLFAQVFHPAMKHIAPVRAAMGVRTVFNILGPLTNPAAPPYGVIGAYSPKMAQLMAESLAGMAHIKRVFVVHGEPGWDEATPVGKFELFDVQKGRVHREVRDPRDAGVSRCSAEDLAGGDAAHNAAELEKVLLGRDRGPHQDALALNTGLLLEATGREKNLADGIAAAHAAIKDGHTEKLLNQLRAFSESLG
ncbi:MAG: anthranilate phosphoribosyltransferase [Gammaproteobacteria bacterium]|nr:anthranilate phosphoribosyltransferase [Gammaproteobacteria bacterium]NND55174.1 anthranilate phosphoribosyltransferase [Gammaproteobacteria bacterium]